MDVKYITPEPLAPLLEKAKVRQYPKGQVILYEGDQPMFVYFLKSGAIKIYDFDANDNEKIIHIGGPGDIFPLLYVFEIVDHVPSSYTALLDCEVYAIPREDFATALETSNNLALYCMKWFAGEVRQLTSRMTSLENTDTRTKLLNALLFLGEHHAAAQNGGWCRVNFAVTQQFLANMIGVSRESVNAVLRDIQAKGVIRLPMNQILEINVNKLRAL